PLAVARSLFTRTSLPWPPFRLPLCDDWAWMPMISVFNFQLLSRCDDKIRNQVPGSEPISITQRRFPRTESFDLLNAVPDASARDLGSDNVKRAVGRGVQTGGARVSLSLIFERTDLNRHTASARSAGGARGQWLARRRLLRRVQRPGRSENAPGSLRR